MFSNGGSLFTRSPYSSSSFSLGTVINSINKTLNVANQAIPIYQKAKPLFKNANSIFQTIKIFNEKPVFNKESKRNITKKIKKDPISINNSTNGPTFFL